MCPKDLAEQLKINPCSPETEQKFVNASRGLIKHYGEKKVAFLNPTDGRLTGMPFQACDVKRPLAAIKKICEKGNLVQFGPWDCDNYMYIKNVASGEKIWLKQERGQYILEASLAVASTF